METNINDYIGTRFTPELAAVLRISFNLFELFEYPDYDLEFENMLSISSSLSSDDLQDKFIAEVNKYLNFILSTHKITLDDDTTLHQKNEVVYALYLLQHIDDYETPVRILESSLTDEEKIAEILSQNCTLSSDMIFSLIADINSELIVYLEKYLYDGLSQQSEELVDDEKRKILNNLKLFNKFTGNNNNVGSVLVNSGAKPNYRLKIYLPFVKEVFKDKVAEEMVVHLFSLLMLAKETKDNVILGYREFNSLFFNDLNDISKMDNALVNLSMQFDKFKIEDKTE
jgi:hypothetical protein